MSRSTLAIITVVVVLGLATVAVVALAQFHMLRNILPFHLFHFFRKSL